jgi:hypothetical protein
LPVQADELLEPSWGLCITTTGEDIEVENNLHAFSLALIINLTPSMRRSKYFSSLATKRTFSSSSSSFSSSPTLKSLSSSSADVPQVKPDPDAHTAHVAKKQKKQKKGSTKRKSNSEAELTAALGKEFPVKDVLGDTCSVLFCGINPGRWSARAEHHYGNPANHFWRLLHESKLVAKPLTFREEHLAVEYGIGLTNIVHRYACAYVCLCEYIYIYAYVCIYAFFLTTQHNPHACIIRVYHPDPRRGRRAWARRR